MRLNTQGYKQIWSQHVWNVISAPLVNGSVCLNLIYVISNSCLRLSVIKDMAHICSLQVNLEMRFPLAYVYGVNRDTEM